MTGGGSHAARGGRIHRAVCGTPARVALAELLELTARGCRNTAPRPGRSAKLKPSPTGRSVLWLHHFGKLEAVFLRDTGLWSSISALSFIHTGQGAPLRAWVGHTAVAAGCS